METLDHYHTKIRKQRDKKTNFVEKVKPLIEESLELIVSLNCNPEMRQFEKKFRRQISKLDGKTKKYLSKAGIKPDYTDLLLCARDLYGMRTKLVSADELMGRTQEYIENHGVLDTYNALLGDMSMAKYGNDRFALYSFATD